MGRKVVIWGQAKSAGSSGLLLKLRLWWWKTFQYLFLYTDDEVKWLKAQGFHNHYISAMNNGLNQRKIESTSNRWPQSLLAKWRLDNGLFTKPFMLSCARLTKKNQFDLVIKALYLLKANGVLNRWVVIGEGDQKRYLKALSRELGVDGQILWCGAIYSENALAPFFLSAEFFIHPGAIGLSLQHAMGYGLPVLTHDRSEFHMPEFAAFQEGVTGLTFKHGSHYDLAVQINQLNEMVPERVRMGENCKKIVQTTHNTDVMTARFIAMVDKIAQA
jgi:glycosyltransferase involved in cell wall biosynthesis